MVFLEETLLFLCGATIIILSHFDCAYLSRVILSSAECKTDDDCPYDKTCRNDNCVTPCLTSDIVCGRGAECRAISHRAQCICPPGTQGDPRVACTSAICHYNEDCADHEACDRLNRICRPVCEDDTCAETATCVARDHQPKCTCPPGTTGNPYVTCAGTRSF